MAMTGYAGAITGVDRNIGRMIEALRASGQLDNTLILFLSDNGACAKDFTREDTWEQCKKPWDPSSFWAFGPGWAHFSDTPFSGFKEDMYEGGVASPLIVHWPARLKQTGGFERRRSHIVDILPTCLAAAGAAYPTRYADARIATARGIDLVPTFTGAPFIAQNEYKYHLGYKHALVQWPWKVVCDRDGNWALHDLSRDRGETFDLRTQLPDRFLQMRERLREWGGVLDAAKTDQRFQLFRDGR
jgi:arylsulfatase A-like enzyme